MYAMNLDTSPRCCICNSTKSFNPHLSYFPVPCSTRTHVIDKVRKFLLTKRQQAWLIAIGIQLTEDQIKISFVCSLHFVSIKYAFTRSTTTNNDLFGNVTILEKCKARDFLKDCLGQLPPILKHTEHGIPTSKEDVDVLCKAFKTGMKCVDDYSSSCLSSEQRRSIENNVMGAKYTFKFLCDDSRFQAEYLKYTTCLRGIKDNWDACANQFVSLVKEEFARKNVSKASRLLEICCARHGFVNCVLVTTRLKCRKEETLFITRIADTLSNTRVYSPHCKNINVTLCSSAQPCLRKSILLMVSAAAIVSICKLFYG